MKILEIETQNYKSLQNVKINFNGDYCPISGANDSGKSSVIKLILRLFENNSDFFRFSNSEYNTDCTQWNLEKKEDIKLKYIFLLSKQDDSGLIAFIKRFADKNIADKKEYRLEIEFRLDYQDNIKYSIRFDTINIIGKGINEIIFRLQRSNCIIVHNSTTTSNARYSFFRNGYTFNTLKSDPNDIKKVNDILKRLENALASISKKRKQTLKNFLSELDHNYSVDFSIINKPISRSEFPMRILLEDKNVKVPIDEWGSGTQNKMAILMSIMQASNNNLKDIKPIVILEEPESFLHPAAQAEFGKVLRKLSKSKGIQIILSTHSPYMLNIDEPSSNILLKKDINKSSRNKVSKIGTVLVDTSDKNWCLPFAEQLGLNEDSLSFWSDFIHSNKKKVLFVEGKWDVACFKHLQYNKLKCGTISSDIEILEIGGKTTLQNTHALQFFLQVPEVFYILYDKDDDRGEKIKSGLEKIKLKKGVHFEAIGLDEAGKTCLEGILPTSVIETVAKDTTLFLRLTGNGKDKESARSTFKERCSIEFCKKTDYTEEELKYLKPIVSRINKIFKC